jgi:hypothetical protein
MIQINWFTQSLKNHTGYDIYMESGEEKRGLKKINKGIKENKHLRRRWS